VGGFVGVGGGVFFGDPVLVGWLGGVVLVSGGGVVLVDSFLVVGGGGVGGGLGFVWFVPFVFSSFVLVLLSRGRVVRRGTVWFPESGLCSHRFVLGHCGPFLPPR